MRPKHNPSEARICSLHKRDGRSHETSPGPALFACKLAQVCRVVVRRKREGHIALGRHQIVLQSPFPCVLMPWGSSLSPPRHSLGEDPGTNIPGPGYGTGKGTDGDASGRALCPPRPSLWHGVGAVPGTEAAPVSPAHQRSTGTPVKHVSEYLLSTYDASGLGGTEWS